MAGSMQRRFTQLHVGAYKLSGGRLGGDMRGFKVLLLTTTGRKSGRQITQPLGYFAHPEGYVIVASNGGSDSHPSWYFNLTSQPAALIQVGSQVMPVTAEIMAGPARAEAWQRVVASAPLYAGYETKTDREIPLILLRPKK